jgi:hypothetical protein
LVSFSPPAALPRWRCKCPAGTIVDAARSERGVAALAMIAISASALVIASGVAAEAFPTGGMTDEPEADRGDRRVHHAAAGGVQDLRPENGRKDRP